MATYSQLHVDYTDVGTTWAHLEAKTKSATQILHSHRTSPEITFPYVTSFAKTGWGRERLWGLMSNLASARKRNS